MLDAVNGTTRTVARKWVDVMALDEWRAMLNAAPEYKEATK